MGTPSVRVQAIPKRDVGAIVLGEDRLRVIGEVFRPYRLLLVLEVLIMLQMLEIILNLDAHESIGGIDL